MPPTTFSTRRRHLRLGGFLLVLLLVPVLFLSQVIESLLPWYLQRQGIQMTVSRAEVDLLARRIRLDDLRIGPSNGLAIEFQQLGARVNLSALLAGEFPLEDLQLHGGELDLEALQQASNTGADSGDAQPIKIPEILIRDLKLKRISKSLGREVVIKRLYLNGLEDDSKNQDGKSLTIRRLRSRIELQFLIGAASLNMDGELNLRGEVVSAEVKLQLHKLKLAGLQKLFAANTRTDLAGQVSADTILKFSYNPNEHKVESRMIGTLDTVGIKFQDKAHRVWLDSNYQGELGIDWPLSTGGRVKLDAKGLLIIAELDLKQTGVDKQNGTLKAHNLRYQGELTWHDVIQTVGVLQAEEATVHLDGEGQDLSISALQLGIKYQSAAASAPLIALTVLKARQFQFDPGTGASGKVNGRELAAEKLTLGRDLSVDLRSFTAAGLEINDLDGPMSVRLDGVKLQQLDTGRKVKLNLKQLATDVFELKRAGQTLQARALSLGQVRQLNANQYAVTDLAVKSLGSDLGVVLQVDGLRAADLNVDVHTALRSSNFSVQELNLSSAVGALTLARVRAKALEYIFKGEVSLAQFSAEHLEQKHNTGARASIQKPAWEKLRLDLSSGTYQVDRFHLEALSASQPVPSARMVSGPLDLRGVDLSEQFNVAIESLAVADFKLGTGDPPQIVLPTLSASKISYHADKGLGLDAVNLVDPVIALGYDAKGEINLPRVPFVEVDEATDKPLPGIHIRKLSTQGKSSFNFIDQQVEPAYKLLIKPFTLAMDGFDSRPDSAPGQYKLIAQTGKFTNLDISGTTQATSNGMDISLAAKLVGLDLKSLSPYTGKYNQFAIRQGSGDLILSGHIKGGKLDLQSKLVLSKLELEPFYQGTSKNPKAEDGSDSLAAALLLLRDNKQTVKLKVPVTGTLGKPEFDFSDATSQAVTGVAKSAVMLAFQPLGILVTAVKLAKNLGATRVETIPFSPAEAKLGAESITLLDSLASKLKSQPKLKLQVCGRVVKADIEALSKKKLPALNDAQLNLSQLRARIVRDYLEQKQLVAAGQLVIVCAASPGDSGDAKPRTELRFDTRTISNKAAVNKVATPVN